MFGLFILAILILEPEAADAIFLGQHGPLFMTMLAIAVLLGAASLVLDVFRFLSARR